MRSTWTGTWSLGARRCESSSAMLIGQTCSAARVSDMVAGLMETKHRSMALCEITVPDAVWRTDARVGWPCSTSISSPSTDSHLRLSRTSLLARTVVCAAVVIVAPVGEAMLRSPMTKASSGSRPRQCCKM